MLSAAAPAPWQRAGRRGRRPGGRGGETPPGDRVQALAAARGVLAPDRGPAMASPPDPPRPPAV
jgi:hypothetical protein